MDRDDIRPARREPPSYKAPLLLTDSAAAAQSRGFTWIVFNFNHIQACYGKEQGGLED
jgi:hypothetical protein